MVLSRGTLVNKLNTSKEHMKTLGSMSRFCMVLTNVNESKMQCDENVTNHIALQLCLHFLRPCKILTLTLMQNLDIDCQHPLGLYI